MGELLRIAVRISKLNLLIIHPIQDELDRILECILGQNFKNMKEEDIKWD